MSAKRRIIHLSRGQDLLEDLYDELPGYASEHLEPTFEKHDPDAASL